MSEEPKAQKSSHQEPTRQLHDPLQSKEPGPGEWGAAVAPADLTSMPFFQAPSLIGTQIDTWRLEAMLGEGGMSVVYLARHMWLQQEAAIKVLLPEYCRDVNVLHRFQQEALAVSRLSHPNIIKVKDFGVDPNHGFFMVLEYLKGQDLEAMMSKAPFPKTWLLHIFEKVCRGLHVTHEAGIVHRDLKPSNIFLVPEEPLPVVKILDFGVAKIQFQETNQSTSKLTKTGVIVGTPAYLAPEQISPRGDTIFASDVYALGVILYQCLTGRLPLEDDTPLGFLLKVLQQEPPLIGTHCPALAGSPLERLVQTMLAKSPMARPQSALDVWKQLKAAASSWDDQRDQPSHYPQIKVSEPQERERPAAKAFSFDETQGQILPTEDREVLDAEGAMLLHQSTDTKAQGHLTRWLVLALGLLSLFGVGAVGLLWRNQTISDHPKAIAAKATPTRSLLDDLVIKGRNALDKKQYLLAVKIWKQALQQKGVEDSRHFPKIYRAIGYAYREKRWVHSSVQYFRKYKEIVKREQEKAATLRQQLAQAKDDPVQRQELDKSLQKLLSRLPSEEQFKQDFQNLSSLREGLQTRIAAGSKILVALRKERTSQRWVESYNLLQQLTEVAPSVPSLHLETARLLATPFLSHALSILRRIKRDMEPSEPQRVAIAALKQSLTARQTLLAKEWRAVLSDVTQMLQSKQSRKALATLKKLLSRSEQLAEGSLHILWRVWLKQHTQTMPRQMRPIWQLYAQKVEELKRKGLWRWLQAHDKLALAPVRIRQISQWIAQVERARLQFLAVTHALGKGRLLQAQREVQRFMREHKTSMEGETWGLAARFRQLQERARRIQAQLQQAVPAWQQMQRAFALAEFGEMSKHRTSLQAALKGTNVLAVLEKQFARQAQMQAMGEKHFQAGEAAFLRYRWKSARSHYRDFLKLFPKAANRAAVEKRLKTCRCALHIYPWETCDRLKLPKGYRKRMAPRRP